MTAYPEGALIHLWLTLHAGNPGNGTKNKLRNIPAVRVPFRKRITAWFNSDAWRMELNHDTGEVHDVAIGVWTDAGEYVHATRPTLNIDRFVGNEILTFPAGRIAVDDMLLDGFDVK